MEMGADTGLMGTMNPNNTGGSPGARGLRTVGAGRADAAGGRSLLRACTAANELRKGGHCL